MNLKEIKELIDLIENSQVEEFEIEKAGVRVRIKKGRGGQVLQSDSSSSLGSASSSKQGAAKEQESSKREEENKGFATVRAPVVGTFYRALTPGAPPYVEEGTEVKKGQVLCLIEAMKLMNEIEAEIEGRITAILVENGQPVEYGQPLFLIDPGSKKD